MAHTTAKYGISVPDSRTDPCLPGSQDLHVIADGFDAIIASAFQGVASARPAAGKSGRFYYATDTAILSYDDGTAWHDILFPPVSATVATAEATASTTPTDLATVGPTVTVLVGSSGKLKVTLGCTAAPTSGNDSCSMTFALSGANTLAAGTRGTANVLALGVSSTGFDVSGSRTVLLSGLTPGSTTVTAKYFVVSASETFSHRDLIVQAL